MSFRYVIPVLALIVTLSASTSSAQRRRSPLISDLDAQRYGLTRTWFAHVEMDRARDRIQSVRLHEGTMFVQTKRGVVQALDAETGRTFWVARVGSPDHPTTAVGASRDYVAVLNATELFLYNRKDGTLLRSRSVVNVPGAGPAFSGKYVFVPTISGVMEAYDVEDLRKPAWMYSSGGRALIQPVATEGSVGWPTDRGNFYVAGTENIGIRFRTEALDEIVAQPAYIPPYFYLAALDGYLYKVHERSGEIAWRFSTGESVVNRPVAVNGRVYVTAQHGGLYCVMADEKVALQVAADERRAAKDRGEEVPDEPEGLPASEGTQIWWSRGMVRLLAVTPTRVYGLDKSGRMLILRSDTGTRISSMSTENQSLGVINHVSDRIYLGTETGLIQCLHEPQLTEPLQYVVTKAIDQPDVEVKQQGLDAAGGEEEGKGVEDLFGDGGDDDDNPFGDAGDDNDTPFGDDGGNPFGDAGGGDDAAGDDAADDAGAGDGGAPPDDNPFGDEDSPF